MNELYEDFGKIIFEEEDEDLEETHRYQKEKPASLKSGDKSLSPNRRSVAVKRSNGPKFNLKDQRRSVQQLPPRAPSSLASENYGTVVKKSSLK